MMAHAANFPVKAEIPCLEKSTYYTEPTGN